MSEAIMTDLFFPADELDRTIANAGAAPRSVTLPESYRSPVETFSEGCRKCGGTGHWRIGYPCFACKGAGRLSFKTSPQARASATAARSDRKVRTAQESLAAFAASYPAIWQWMDGNSFDFAVSLRASVERFGSLTPNQLAAAQRCIDKRNAAIEARKQAVAVAPTITIVKIETAFATAAANGLKRPKLRIAGFTFSLAPTSGKNAGAIYVKRGDAYLGKVQASKLMCVGGVDTETREKIVTIASDPEQAATMHGIQTETCSCCGAELTNKISRARGIGPICAAKYGW
jgi:hypothetical protein